jgi:hypothetical protein
MRNLLRSRRGTAEVIGSIMFIVILLFFFTNVYLWHDAAVKDADAMFLKQVKAGMELSWVDDGVGSDTKLMIRAVGSDILLSRLWIVTTENEHLYADLGAGVSIAAGRNVNFTFSGYDVSNGAIRVDDGFVRYPLGNDDRVLVLNTLGVTAVLER